MTRTPLKPAFYQTAFMMLVSVIGCTLPMYERPQGFSSTYRQHLKQEAISNTFSHSSSSQVNWSDGENFPANEHKTEH